MYSRSIKKSAIRNAGLAYQTPQSQFIPGREAEMDRNHAGGVTFTVTPLEQVKRFLIMGAAGTYYVGQDVAIAENVTALQTALHTSGGQAVVDLIVSLNADNRARVDTTVFALAWLSVNGDQSTKAAVFASLPQTVRTLRQLYDLVYQRHVLLEGRGGWGTGFRNAIANWLNQKNMRELAMQFIKYRSGTYDRIFGRDQRIRAGKRWSEKLTITPGMLLGAAHVVPTTPNRSSLYNYVAARSEQTRATEEEFLAPDTPPSLRVTSLTEDDAAAFDLLWAYEHAQKTTDVKRLLNLIEAYGLTWEMVPNTWFSRDNLKQAQQVWRKLLGVDGGKWGMPMGAMLRNLSRFSGLSLFDDRDVRQYVIDKFTGNGAAERLRKARLHPVDILDAYRVYSSGRGREGKSTWMPSPAIVDMLEATFDLSFQAVEPSGVNLFLALDISGSMGGGSIAGLPGLTPREGAAVMAMVTARREHGYRIFGFSHDLIELDISARDSLNTVLNKLSKYPFGTTDCAQPMLAALKMSTSYQGFAVYTDNETWAGNVQPAQALRNYRQAKGVDARLAVVAMQSTRFTIADPRDPGMLDFVGFDSSAPRVMSDFFAGKL